MILAGARTVVLERLRRHGRPIIWPAEGINGGNYLYLWLRAWCFQRRGLDARVRHRPNMGPWLKEFPALAPLTLPAEDVRFRDQRLLGWHQGYGDDFSQSELQEFISDVLLQSVTFRAARDDAEEQIGDIDVVVNVRRGDYYSVEGNRRNYGFDIRAYAQAAVASLLPGGPESVAFVSDDLDWCYRELPGLWEGTRVVLIPRSGMMSDFAALAVAQRLVLANSTFSYWGGYINTQVRLQPGRIAAPEFHSRNINEGKSWHLDPRWTIIRNAASEMYRSRRNDW
ncbi:MULTISPECIES: alpha-1,2-fucosyltransferase [Arthrobacter]|uniref:Alpha-1,2-fucosyltransferase n=2 Tax=Arthrobacter TaxID=1663 RepID=A0ABU9KLE0_9MICC|nr:alpha-1,2-fucosyltransferase [Arthrobacter sp. YJM1]MDP5227726.1 alpha-1,2-fucosyltransferase [Arthrobacter sp. YJM1]